jgi:hypothetical protein
MRNFFKVLLGMNPSDREAGQPDLKAEFEVVNARIEQAARDASAKLTQLGVRHVLIGGLAVGSWARPRATKDVDFLVGPEAYVSHGSIISMIPELPWQVGTVAVDNMLAPHEAPSIEEALGRGIVDEGIPIAPPEVIVLMKLIAKRPQDIADLAALLEFVDHDVARDYVAKHGPRYSPKLDMYIKAYRLAQGLDL